LRGMRPGPPPAHKMGIWVGAYGPRMLDLIGRLADGWVPSLGYSPPEKLPEMQERIDEAATEAERESREIQRIYNVGGSIGEEHRGLLDGPVEHWAEELTRFAVEIGMDTFIYWPSEDHVRQIDLFATEVVPAVRESVAAERSQASK
jgi:alkanesulfonate monooxygenase SsuD/methylene tetrahydromethanopterin reductase-like flavin-dependent oxidoreductase (luciferase family)